MVWPFNPSSVGINGKFLETVFDQNRDAEHLIRKIWYKNREIKRDLKIWVGDEGEKTNSKNRNGLKTKGWE